MAIYPYRWIARTREAAIELAIGTTCMPQASYMRKTQAACMRPLRMCTLTIAHPHATRYPCAYAHPRLLTRTQPVARDPTRPPMQTSLQVTSQIAQGPKPASPRFLRAFPRATHVNQLARTIQVAQPTDLFFLCFKILFNT